MTEPIDEQPAKARDKDARTEAPPESPLLRDLRRGAHGVEGWRLAIAQARYTRDRTSTGDCSSPD
jgi:hypothetical protein